MIRTSAIITTAILLIAFGVSEARAATQEELIQAATKGKEDVIASYLGQGGDANAKHSQGRTLLHEASNAGQAAIVKLLVERGADVNARDSRNQSPLSLACKTGNSETVKLLLAGEAQLSRLKPSAHVLSSAAGSGDVQTLKLLLDSGVGLDCRSALASAAQTGHVEAVKLLLARGADVSPHTPGGRSALSLAANGTSIECIKLILEKRKELGNEDLGQALIEACPMGSREVIAFILEQGPDVSTRDEHGRTALHYAARRNSPDLVKSLIEAKSDVNAQDKWGMTALMCSISISEICIGGHEHTDPRVRMQVVEILVSGGADVNLLDKRGRSALEYAVRLGRKDVAAFLKSHGADPANVPSAQDMLNHTNLIKAIRAGDNDALKKLIASGVNVNAVTLDGSTPLMSACTGLNKNLETIRLLLDSGADANVRTASQTTALSSAVNDNAGPDVVKLLVERGADPKVKDSTGRTPITILCHRRADMVVRFCFDDKKPCENDSEIHFPLSQSQNLMTRLGDKDEAVIEVRGKSVRTILLWHPDRQGAEVARLLLAAGADANAKDGTGKTALALAREKGFTKIAEVLQAYGAKE